MKLHFNHFLPIIDAGRGIESTILLSSTARSGSTFFANILNHNQDHRILFEPLSVKHVKEAGELKLPMFIPYDLEAPRYTAFYTKLLCGDISNKWIDRENRSGFYRKRIVKEVRSNLHLSWLQNQFPNLKIVLLMRNPISVIDSWERMNFENGHELKRIINEELFQRIPKELKTSFKNEKNAFILSLYFWCINNAVANELNDKYSLVVNYEDLLERNKETFKNIDSFTGIKIQEAPESSFERISSSSSEQKLSNFDRLMKLKEQIGLPGLSQAKELLDAFGLANYYQIL